MTVNQYSSTLVQLHYGLEGDESLRARSFLNGKHGGVIDIPHLGALDDRMEVNHLHVLYL